MEKESEGRCRGRKVVISSERLVKTRAGRDQTNQSTQRRVGGHVAWGKGVGCQSELLKQVLISHCRGFP